MKPQRVPVANGRTTRTTRLSILTAFAYPLVLSNPAPAEAQLFVGSTGDDSNACNTPASPCATIQGAINKVPGGSLGVDIHVAHGSYPAPINIYYHRAMRIVGNCSDIAAVEIKTSGVAIWVQDHAIGIVQCLTISATGPGATGIAGRQYSIIDIDRIRFGAFPNGQNIALSEDSKLSCLPGPSVEPVILTGSGSATFAVASGGSKLYLNCPISFEGDDPQTFTYFTQCVELSICNYTGLAWRGPDIIGKQFNCDNSDLTKPSGQPPLGYSKSIPGDGFDDLKSRCRLR